MRVTHRKRWVLLGAAFGGGVSAVVVSAFAMFVGVGAAAQTVAPRNTSPPTISGTPQEGRTLTGDRGEWSGNPTDFDFFWMRCDRNGGSCSNISGANGRTYRLTSADVGNTVRFRVRAENADGQTSASSVPTAVITAAVAPPPPPPPRGCPAGPGPVSVTAVTPPARLVVDQVQSDPQVVTGGTTELVARFHVSNSCGQAVQGALVYATAVPFNQLSIPPEQPTGSDGWVELRFQMLRGFPVSPRQQLIAMFVRARKQGESLLGGISTRRLVSIPVRL